jgi:hypothetical protein
MSAVPVVGQTATSATSSARLHTVSGGGSVSRSSARTPGLSSGSLVSYRSLKAEERTWWAEQARSQLLNAAGLNRIPAPSIGSSETVGAQVRSWTGSHPTAVASAGSSLSQTCRRTSTMSVSATGAGVRETRAVWCGPSTRQPTLRSWVQGRTVAGPDRSRRTWAVSASAESSSGRLCAVNGQWPAIAGVVR